MCHRRVRHWTVDYVFNRIAVMVYERKYPDHPWLTADAVRILGSMLRPSHVGVEFGSGRSTRWFASRLAKLTSVESDPAWFNKVQQSLKSLPDNARVDYRLCVNDQEYASQSETFTDNSIDFCLVDGNVRDQCALAMLPKIRGGGVMVVDNVNWFLPNDTTKSPGSRRTSEGCASQIWQRFADQVSEFPCIWTTNGVTDTAIYIKRNGLSGE